MQLNVVATWIAQSHEPASLPAFNAMLCLPATVGPMWIHEIDASPHAHSVLLAIERGMDYMCYDSTVFDATNLSN